MSDEPSPSDTPAADGAQQSPVPGSRRAAREARQEPAPPAPPAEAGRPATPDASFEGFLASAQAPASARDTTTTRTHDGAGSPGGSSSLDDLFSGERTTNDIGMTPSTKRKKRSRKGPIIALIIILALVGGAAGAGWWAWSTYEDKIREVMGWEEPKDYEDGMATGEAYVTIVEGDTGESISVSLAAAGVTKTPEAFYDYLIETEQSPDFFPGVYRLQLQMTSAAALAALEDPANKMENTALVREGLTVDQTIEILSTDLGIPLADFQAAVADPAVYGVSATTLEGWLFPATYTFDAGVAATDIIARMVSRAVESLDAAGVPVDDRERILTIASIIQREARFEQDFYNVSRVIYNRLDIGMKLQMDSTAQYGYGEMHDGTVSTSGAALSDDNPWNTYVIDGLPATPIANPGDLAIDAAMHPADGPWLYFVTVNLDTGETVFTTTYDDHLAAVEQWQQWCAANPDSGC
ncbi:hypothetical protein GCM10009808_08120 [Microbacterium sediminicola]|uniref:Endolytic murein transglycosylase n=1 Tax=Microbacterium sediminicola TaxID=415210 RepID=A0ABP4TVR5_9MICO